jgi:hypothetical protein
VFGHASATRKRGKPLSDGFPSSFIITLHEMTLLSAVGAIGAAGAYLFILLALAFALREDGELAGPIVFCILSFASTIVLASITLEVLSW